MHPVVSSIVYFLIGIVFCALGYKIFDIDAQSNHFSLRIEFAYDRISKEVGNGNTNP